VAAVIVGAPPALSGHPANGIAYAGDRLDNDIAPTAGTGLVTVWVQRGPGGYILRPDDSPSIAGLRPGDPSLTVATRSGLAQVLCAKQPGN